MATNADADAVAQKTGKATKLISGKVHTLNVGTGVWQEYKHKRDADGKFAKKVGVPNPPNLHALSVSTKPGKQPPANWKFYKPGYKPKEWSKIAGANAYSDGKLLWLAKKSGDIKNDYEFWLLAQKLAAKYKKSHPTNAATANGIVNAAFRHELEETGDVQIGNGGTKSVAPKPLNVPKFDKGKTPTGLSMTSKHAPPGTLMKFVKTMPGATGAQVWEDDKGQEWLVKGLKQGQSNAYSNKNFAVALEEATAKIQNKAGLRSATSHKTTLQGKTVLAQKMFGGVSFAFPGGPKIDQMSDADKLEMQKHQMLDWVLSNFDTHTGNFLKDDKGVIGIDKGQAFKFFGKDKLSWDYAPVSPLGSDKPTYQTMWKDYIDGKGEMFDLSNHELSTFADRLAGIDDAEYKDLLRPYAEAAYDANTLSAPGAPLTGKDAYVGHFLNLAVSRKNNVVKDFEEFFAKAKDAKDKKNAPADNGNATTTGKFVASNYKPVVGELVKVQDFEGDVSTGKVVSVNNAGDQIEMEVDNDTGTWAKVGNSWFFEGDTDSPPDSLEFEGEKAWNEAQKGQEPQQVTKVTDLKVGDLLEFDGEIVGVTKLIIPDNAPGLSYAKVLGPSGKWGKVKQFHLDNGTAKMVGTPSAPAKPKPKKIKQEGEPASFASLEVGDWVSFMGQPAQEVKGKGTNEISLGLGTLVNKTAFDEGKYTWGKPATPTDHPKLAKGFKVVPHPTEQGKFAIQKPAGGYSANKSGETKAWDSEQEALDSTTMAKYKTNEAQYQPGASSATSFNYQPGNPFTASNAYGNLTPEQLAKDYPNMTQADSEQYNDLVEAIGNGTASAEDYIAYKKLGSKFANAKKAAGAAQIEHDFSVGGFQVQAPKSIGAVTPTTTKMPTPAWKKKGGAPPPLSKATGPNALSSGAELYEMKKAGKFKNDDEMWKAASKLSNQYKAKVQKANPGKKLVSGEDYSSPNQIRNVAQRLEFDEHGDVLWETKEQLTSHTDGQTLSQMKHALSLHDHEPKYKHAASHAHAPKTDHTLAAQIWSDTSKPPGSYQNPHAFQSVQQLNKYGDTYTDHAGWNTQQKSAWYSFTGAHSGEINTYFRVQESGFSHSNSAQAKKWANGMIDAFASKNVKPLDDWTIVTRGTSGGWEFGIGSDMVDVDDIKAMKGKVVRNKCPVSSSLHVDAAFSSKPISITYKLPPGFRGIFAGNHSAHPSENEMILPPGMAYRIIDVQQDPKGKIQVVVEVVDVKLPEKFV